MIRISMTSVMVDDQAKALQFYTNILGFVTKKDIPMGEARWLTVVGPGEPDGTELLLEPVSGLAEASVFQKALFAAGIPATAFGVEDVAAEYERMKGLGVEFRGEPTKPEFGPSMVMLNDTCGNLIQLFQLHWAGSEPAAVPDKTGATSSPASNPPKELPPRLALPDEGPAPTWSDAEKAPIE